MSRQLQTTAQADIADASIVAWFLDCDNVFVDHAIPEKEVIEAWFTEERYKSLTDFCDRFARANYLQVCVFEGNLFNVRHW